MLIFSEIIFIIIISKFRTYNGRHKEQAFIFHEAIFKHSSCHILKQELWLKASQKAFTRWWVEEREEDKEGAKGGSEERAGEMWKIRQRPGERES